jgi:hypothetical protein
METLCYLEEHGLQRCNTQTCFGVSPKCQIKLSPPLGLLGSSLLLFSSGLANNEDGDESNYTGLEPAVTTLRNSDTAYAGLV